MKTPQSKLPASLSNGFPLIAKSHWRWVTTFRRFQLLRVRGETETESVCACVCMCTSCVLWTESFDHLVLLIIVCCHCFKSIYLGKATVCLLVASLPVHSGSVCRLCPHVLWRVSLSRCACPRFSCRFHKLNVDLEYLHDCNSYTVPKAVVKTCFAYKLLQ